MKHATLLLFKDSALSSESTCQQTVSNRVTLGGLFTGGKGIEWKRGGAGKKGGGGVSGVGIKAYLYTSGYE